MDTATCFIIGLLGIGGVAAAWGMRNSYPALSTALAVGSGLAVAFGGFVFFLAVSCSLNSANCL
jgi:hypothetical protein